MQPSPVLKLAELQAYIRIGKTKIYELIAEGSFPKPLKIGGKSSRWLRPEIDQWLDKKAKDRHPI